MRLVVFVAPFPMVATMKFARALSSIDGVLLLGVFQNTPNRPEVFDLEVRVPDVFDVSQMSLTLQQIQQRFGRIHRLVGILEQLQDHFEGHFERF